MHERRERFVEVQIAHIPQSFGKEAGVEQMHTGVFRAADIFVDGKHFVDYFRVESLFVVMRVGVAQEIPATAHERVQSVGVAFCLCSAYRTGRVHEFVAFEKR